MMISIDVKNALLHYAALTTASAKQTAEIAKNSK